MTVVYDERIILSATIKNNLRLVKENIYEAAHRAGRDPASIKLVVVSKKRSDQVVKAAIDCGVICFGENYPEEGAKKILTFNGMNNLEWHMIGHVQSRKINLVCAHYDFIHSIDSLKLAKALEAKLTENKRILPALLEVNVSGEESKYGFEAYTIQKWCGLVDLLKGNLKFISLKICGLMTMPPLFTDPEKARPYFCKLVELQAYLNKNVPEINWHELSMGTSADYKIAIEEGATMVRIGEAILGPRTA